MRTGKILLLIAIILIIVGCIIGAIMYQVHEFYARSDPVLDEITSALETLFQKDNFKDTLTDLNHGSLLDKVTIRKSKTGSYTINKKHVYICMHDKHGEYYDRNMLIYVLIHELAHVICDEIGHTDKFNQINDEFTHRSYRNRLI